ncbi:MAG TPA: hypothetical protein VHL34_24690 [Rhizomicrobium sp.]|nr:hypothetical protein [Rhizomicrobium sp.]
MRTPAHDPRCYDLAEFFLEGADINGATLSSAEVKRYAPELAQHIQDAVEAWLGYDLLESAAIDHRIAAIVANAKASSDAKS